MNAIFRHQLRRFRGSMLGWGLPLAFLAAYLIPFYTQLQDQIGLLRQLMEVYPKELLAIFGVSDFDSMLTPHGFLHVELFSYLPVVLGIFALLAGSSLISGDEEQGLLDLLLSLPVSRTRFFLARFLAFLVATWVILALIWAGASVSSAVNDFGLGAVDLLLPFVDVFSVLLLTAALALCLSQILPAKRVAAMLTGLVLIGSFFLNGLMEINSDVEGVARLLPLYYYQGGYAVEDLNLSWLVGKLGVGVVFLIIGWWRFLQRDIRVSGEGDWPRPRLRRRPAAPVGERPRPRPA